LSYTCSSESDKHFDTGYTKCNIEPDQNIAELEDHLASLIFTII